MNAALASTGETMTWDDGIGFLDPGPDACRVYDLTYWQRYVERSETEIGRALTASRVELTGRFCLDGPVCDVGIGCGMFIKARGGETYGFDINPVAVEWLHQHDKWMDPRGRLIPTLTFWDTLEHIPDPTPYLAGVTGFVLLSAPIFKDRAHVLRSKHLKPGEHCYYWTHEGLIRFMGFYGFGLVEHNTMESDLGREDIGTYVFKRQRRAYLTGLWNGQTTYCCPWCEFDTLEGEERILCHVRNGHASSGIRLVEGA